MLAFHKKRELAKYHPLAERWLGRYSFQVFAAEFPAVRNPNRGSSASSQLPFHFAKWCLQLAGISQSQPLKPEDQTG